MLIRRCSVLLLVFLFLVYQDWNAARTSPIQTAAAIKVSFSPNGGCTEAIVKTLDQAMSCVLIQSHSFNSAPIAKAAVEARERGVKVKVILDKSQLTERYFSADFLAHAGINVSIDYKHNTAHNTIMIIDHDIVITGSFDFTKSAEEDNAENLLIIQSMNLAAKYTDNWNKHAAHSEAYAGK